MSYYFYGGDFLETHENGLTPKINENSSDIFNGFKFGLRGGLDWPAIIYFTGPEADPFLVESPSENRSVFDNNTYFFSTYVEEPKYPPDGKYLVDYNVEGVDKALRFNVAGQSEASEKTVLPIPRIELNHDDTINKVTWVYSALDNVSDIDPRVVVDSVELQISMINNDDYRYLSGNLAADTQEHILENQAIEWSNVNAVVLAYDDVYGNHNVVAWENKQFNL